MELPFFQYFRESFNNLSCFSSPTANSIDLQNFSALLENNETLHSRSNSYTLDEIFSNTQPVGGISKLAIQAENDLASYKQLTSSIKSNNPSLFRKFIKLLGNLEHLNNKNRTFLHISAKYGSLDICQLILAFTQSNINSRDKERKSPLHLAALNGHVNVVKFLHRCGGYLHIKDKSQKSVIDYAIESKNVELIMFVFEKSPSIGKGCGFNVKQLLKANGISIDKPKILGNDEKSKVKKVEWQDLIGLSDFSIVQEVGRGSFGVVYLVKLEENGKALAMKVMVKEKIYGEGLEDYVCTEKNVMARIESEFIVKLRYAFQTLSLFCLVMDYCPGGTLAQVILRCGKVREEIAKKYLSEIVIAFECLHDRDVIYRDLKPENVLIDEMGHVRLTDFGLAKTGVCGDQSAASFCGTFSYLAPEILEKKHYGKSVDWYSFGVLMFELLTGSVPKGKSIKKDIKKLNIQKFISPEAKDLIEGLMFPEYKKRIGFKGAEQVKLHEFFSEIDWDVVKNKELLMDKPEVKVIKSRLIHESDLPSGREMRDLENWSFVRAE